MSDPNRCGECGCAFEDVCRCDETMHITRRDLYRAAALVGILAGTEFDHIARQAQEKSLDTCDLVMMAARFYGDALCDLEES